MGGITDQYSGVILNQNAVRTGSVNSGTVYQDFFLPVDYQRAPSGNSVIPDLSGAEVGMIAASIPISLPWGIDHFDPASGWTTITEAVLTNVPYLGVFFWAQLNAPGSVPISATWLGDRFRLWIQMNPEVIGICFTAPN